MLLAQDIRPLPRSPQQRLAIIATVAAIHIAVIAAFLSGLGPKVFAPENERLIVDIRPDTHRPPLPPPPLATDNFARPKMPNPDVPNFVESNNNDDTIHDPPAGPTAPTHPSGILVAPQAIAGTHTTPD